MIADDLTGACDAGVKFAEAGLATIVWLEYGGETAQITVVTTDSRADSPDTARAKVRQACLWMERREIRLGYKKIDSTLCGNVEAEIEAALDATGIESAWICPAFPDMGRTVADGWLHVRGERLARVPSGHRLRALDAASDEELARIAAEAFAGNPPPLLVGSAGLAAHVARNAAAGRAHAPAPGPMARPARILLAIGSKNAITTVQAGRVRKERPGIEIVHMSWDQRDCLAFEQVPGALILTGGDTARWVCGMLGARGIRLEREVLTGIPLGRLIGGAAHGALVVTKAGGFGDDGALLRAVEFLEQCDRH
jgi:uncharacterized protein YgbK (DUF1537 family)